MSEDRDEIGEWLKRQRCVTCGKQASHTDRNTRKKYCNGCAPEGADLWALND